MQRMFKNKFLLFVAALLLLLLVNSISGLVPLKWDMTEEKRFTLSKPVEQLVTNLDSVVSIKVFLKGNYPSGFRKLSSSTESLLRELRTVSNGKVRYELIAPEDEAGPSVNWGDSLTAMGLIPLNLTSQVKAGQQQQYVFPYALVTYQDKVIPVSLYSGKTPMISFAELNSAEAMLEYNLASAISRITRKERATVGYSIGNGEPTGINTYDLVENVLQPNYNLFTINLKTQPSVPDVFDVLMIVKPTEPFSQEELLKLDQYVMHGGKLILCIDRLHAELDSLQANNETTAYDRGLNIHDLIFKYGARINPDLVMDLQCDFLPFDINGNGQFEFLPWNYFPVLESPSNHPINKNLGFTVGRFVNSIDTIASPEIKKTVLLHSSVNGRTIGGPALISGKENSLQPEDARFNKKNIPVAVLLEGKFSSFYKNRVTPAIADSLKSYGINFKDLADSAGQIVVVADGDVVLNSVVKNQPIGMGMNAYTFNTQREFPFANRSFIENSLSYMTDKHNLSEARNKDYVARLLNTKKVEEERSFWQLINIGLPILLILIFAALFNYFRKLKYSNG